MTKHDLAVIESAIGFWACVILAAVQTGAAVWIDVAGAVAFWAINRVARSRMYPSQRGGFWAKVWRR